MSGAGLRLALMALALGAGAPADAQLTPYRIVGDAIPASLTGRPGDAGRGASIVGDRMRGLCILCHSGPFGDPRFQGTLSPNLAGTGSRATPGQLRLRLVDGRKLNPDTIMPAYYGLDGLDRVGPAWRGRTILDAGEIEDVVAYLATLEE